jgi:hypothetical protein
MQRQRQKNRSKWSGWILLYNTGKQEEEKKEKGWFYKMIKDPVRIRCDKWNIHVNNTTILNISKKEKKKRKRYIDIFDRIYYIFLPCLLYEPFECVVFFYIMKHYKCLLFRIHSSVSFLSCIYSEKGMILSCFVSFRYVSLFLFFFIIFFSFLGRSNNRNIIRWCCCRCIGTIVG